MGQISPNFVVIRCNSKFSFSPDTSVSACFPLKGRRTTQWSARENKRQVEWKLGGLTFSAIEH